MTRVVERCATCGVEHEARVDECEACGGALRYWCRSHSRALGWLQTAECHGCVEETARLAPRPAPAPPRTPAPRKAPARAPAPAPARVRRPPSRTPARPAPLVGTPVEGLVEVVRGDGTAVRGSRGPRARAAVLTLLWTWILCILFFAGFGLVRALRSGEDVGALVVDGAGVGWLVGLLVGAGITLYRLSHP
jgi:hypothetical protein